MKQRFISNKKKNEVVANRKILPQPLLLFVGA